MAPHRTSRGREIFRILSFDGGGVRGVLSARLAERLEARESGFLASFDLLAGTSTGGLIAAGLASGRTPGEIVGLFRERAAEVFDDSWLDDLRDLGKLTGADYATAPLKRILRQWFARSTLGDLKKPLMVPAFDLDATDEAGIRRWKPKYFHNFPGPDSDAGESVVDVLLRACAAPTYFPSYQGYIDGGVVGGNPSMAALALALDPRAGGRALEQIMVFSLGTGLSPAFIRGNRHDWGVAQWARPLARIMSEGAAGVADFQCRQLLGERYVRLDPVLPEPIALDAADRIDRLIEIADETPLDV
jgi:uncharacterized protein